MISIVEFWFQLSGFSKVKIVKLETMNVKRKVALRWSKHSFKGFGILTHLSSVELQSLAFLYIYMLGSQANLHVLFFRRKLKPR